MGMPSLDTRALKYKQLIAHLCTRMEPALRIATRAVISSSAFHLKVLCANHVQLNDGRKVLDPNYAPTNMDRTAYRDMMGILSTKHRLYAHDHGSLHSNVWRKSLFSSNDQEYVWWTVLNAWFIEEHYARMDYEQFPGSQRRSVDLVLAITLAHEFTHTVKKYRDWLTLFSKTPYQHHDPAYVQYCECPSRNTSRVSLTAYPPLLEPSS